MLKVSHYQVELRRQFPDGWIRSAMVEAILSWQLPSHFILLLLMFTIEFPSHSSAHDNALSLWTNTATPIVIAASQDWYGINRAYCPR
jgi:hypothetical protein